MLRSSMVAMAVAAVTLGACSDDATTSAATTTTSTAGSGGAGAGGDTGSGGDGGVGGTTTTMPFSSDGDSSYEAQTSIAADDQGGMVAVWIAFYDDDSTAIGYTVSRDHGVNWTAPRYVSAPEGRRSSNPVVAADGKGRFGLAWLGFRASAQNPDEHIYFSLLDPNDDSFPEPVIASDDGSSTQLDFDKPFLTTDAVDDFLLTWADFTATGSLTFARTSDGSTFDRNAFADDATFGNLAFLCLDRSLGANAPLYVVHLAIGATLYLHRSIDGGVNWTAHPMPAADVLFQDPTCAVSGDRIWMAYAEGTGFSPTSDTPADSVRVIHSADRGDTMDVPVVASDVSGDNYLFPRIVRAADGKLAIVYYQGRLAEEVRLVVSTSQNGTTWNTSPIANAGTMTADNTLANWLGAYVGVTPALTPDGDDVLATTYTDNSGVKDRISFATFAAP